MMPRCHQRLMRPREQTPRPLCKSFRMINDLWYKNAVVYCLNVGTYMDSNADGIGDFQGLMRRLDYLHGLGVTALWLMPFQKSPCRDDGYDISDYYAVDPRYGTLGDFVEFTHGARQRGMRVLIDLVVNHTSNEHAWFQDARRDPQSKYRDWYLWSKKKPPHANQGMVFPGVQKTTWSYDKEARLYYFHRFYDFQPDLNTSHPLVLAEILKIMGFWIQLGVSGFRMAAVPFVMGTKGPAGAKAGRAVRHAARPARVPAMAPGRLHHPRRGQRVAEDRPGLFRRRRRAHADDVQLPGEPASLLRPGGGRLPAAGQGDEADQAPAIDRAVGHVPAQPRRARPRAPHRRAARERVQGVRARKEHAALRPRHPAAPRADARGRPPPHRARLQPDVHAARHAGAALRRRARHGRQPRIARTQLRAHPDRKSVV